jgi:hypothetical protein
MAAGPKLIIQVPRGSAVERWLSEQPLAGIASGEIIVEAGPVDADGYLEPPAAGRVILSYPSPEALAREADEVRRMIRQEGTSTEPPAIVLQDAEELREEELSAVLEAAGHGQQPVILRVIRGS